MPNVVLVFPGPDKDAGNTVISGLANDFELLVVGTGVDSDNIKYVPMSMYPQEIFRAFHQHYGRYGYDAIVSLWALPGAQVQKLTRQVPGGWGLGFLQVPSPIVQIAVGFRGVEYDLSKFFDCDSLVVFDEQYAEIKDFLLGRLLPSILLQIEGKIIALPERSVLCHDYEEINVLLKKLIRKCLGSFFSNLTSKSYLRFAVEYLDGTETLAAARTKLGLLSRSGIVPPDFFIRAALQYNRGDYS